MEIGVPTRFGTPRADIDVVTRAARAPALLTAYKVDAAGERLQVDLHLQTGVRTALRQTLASVAEGPFRSAYQVGAGDILPAVPNVAYFLHSYMIGMSNTAATAGTMGFITWDDYLDAAGDNSGQINAFIVPSVANVVNVAGVLDVLTRPGEAVTWGIGGAPSANYVQLFYAIVSGVM